jgi:hypothetical protein
VPTYKMLADATHTMATSFAKLTVPNRRGVPSRPMAASEDSLFFLQNNRCSLSWLVINDGLGKHGRRLYEIKL